MHHNFISQVEEDALKVQREINADNKKKHYEYTSRGVNATPETRKTYLSQRSARILKEREDILNEFNCIPQIHKFKCNVSNGFSIIGLTENEVCDILTMFYDKMSLRKHKVTKRRNTRESNGEEKEIK
jgi:hypothetical protein